MTTRPQQELSINQAINSQTMASDSANSGAGWVPQAFGYQAAGINNQKHIRNTTAGELDLNLGDVWMDYTGTGVNVAVYDNGVEATHPDLINNYTGSLEIRNNDASPEANDFHGTAVAGIIAAQNDGTWGPVGIAFDANIVGVDIWDNSMGPATNPEGVPLGGTTDVSRTTFSRENFDIVNQSVRFNYFENQGNSVATNVYDNIELAARGPRRPRHPRGHGCRQ